MEFRLQAKDFMTCKQIVIGTPKRVLHFLQRKTINLRKTTYLVVDEADQLLDMGLESQMKMIIEQIRVCISGSTDICIGIIVR